jgi:hypothetical protein
LIQGTCDLIQGTFDLIQGTFDLIQGTFDLIQGTCDLIQGTFDLIQGTWKGVGRQQIPNHAWQRKYAEASIIHSILFGSSASMASPDTTR